MKDWYKNIDIENIYQTVIDLEGPKYPINNWNALERAADYLIQKLESYGCDVEVQEFDVEDFEHPFRNIIGHIGDPSKPAVLIGSHYDTVRGAPGANDNLSAVAVSLEIARVLCLMENPPSVTIAVFTLEEGHPTRRLRIDRMMQEKGWFNDQYQPVSIEIKRVIRNVSGLLNAEYNKSKAPLPVIYKNVIDEHKPNLNTLEMNYLTSLYDVIKTFDTFVDSDTKSAFAVGSTKYAKKVVRENIPIDYVINYDCLGWIFNEEHTQKPLPLSDELLPLMSFHKTDLKSTIGNYLVIMGEQHSKQYVDSFSNNLRGEPVDIPHMTLHLAFDFNTIYNVANDTLRSDHAPFWEVGIPGIFISDGANFRSSYYHTGEDKSKYMNFDVLRDVAIGTIKTILDNH